MIALISLTMVMSLCAASGIAWRWASTRDVPVKTALSMAGVRFVLDRLGVSTCLTMEYRTQPGLAGPQLHHSTLVLGLPPFLGGTRLGQIDLATLIGHQTLRQHVLCWS